MSSAGRSGMSGRSDTERTNLQGGRDNLTGANGPLMPGDDAPIDQVEIVEIVEVDDDLTDMGPTGFRWWYVPAIGLPLGVGAGAAIWYLTKGEEPYLNAWELVTRPVRNLTGQSTVRAKTKRAARKAGATSDTLRDRVADALSGFDAGELAEKAGDLWEDARDSMADLWDQITDRDTLSQVRGTAGDARDTARRQLGKVAGNIAAAGTALAIQQKANDLAGGAKGGAWRAGNRAQAQASDLKQRVKGQLAKQGAKTPTKATAKAVKVKSGRAVKRARRRVTSPFRRMGTFALAALITAMIIYIRSWYSRRTSTAGKMGNMDTEDMRETASGRMEPDTWPRFAGRTPDAAPSATSSPTEPS